MTYFMKAGLSGVEDLGLTPYKINGDPVTALVAQLNRFAGKTITPGGTCGPRKLVNEPFTLIPSIDNKAATAAALIVFTRYSCTPTDVASATKQKWANGGLFDGNTWAFVMNNITEITTTIAQFGDSMGLPPATVGITTKDPKMAPKFPTTTIVAIGVMAVAAVVMSGWGKR